MPPYVNGNADGNALGGGLHSVSRKVSVAKAAVDAVFAAIAEALCEVARSGRACAGRGLGGVERFQRACGEPMTKIVHPRPSGPEAGAGWNEGRRGSLAGPRGEHPRRASTPRRHARSAACGLPGVVTPRRMPTR